MRDDRAAQKEVVDEFWRVYSELFSRPLSDDFDVYVQVSPRSLTIDRISVRLKQTAGREGGVVVNPPTLP